MIGKRTISVSCSGLNLSLLHRNCHTLICFTCPCACLHPLQVSPIFPIIPCVFIPVFSVCLCQLVLFAKSTSSFLLAPVFPSLWPSPVLTLCPPPWTFCLPLFSSLPAALYRFGLWSGYEVFPWTIINIRAQTTCLPCLRLVLASVVIEMGEWNMNDSHPICWNRNKAILMKNKLSSLV
jgi:hypothetical protein